MKKAFWTSEKLLSLTAVFVSICTLIVFLYQTNLIRKQQYMSVFPYVTIGHYGTSTKNYKLVISNDGIGPALIKAVKVKDKQGKLYTDIVDYVNAIITENDSIGFGYSNIYKGRLIPEKEIVEIIVVSDGKLESSERMLEVLTAEGLFIELKYESIYGETWVVTNEMNYPEKR